MHWYNCSIDVVLENVSKYWTLLFTMKELTLVKSCCTDLCLESIPICVCDQPVSWWGQVDCFRHQSSCWNQGSGVILRGRAPGQGRCVQREAGQRGRVTLLCVESLHMELCPFGIRGITQQLLRVPVSCRTLRGLVLQSLARWRDALYSSFLYAVLQLNGFK